MVCAGGGAGAGTVGLGRQCRKKGRKGEDDGREEGDSVSLGGVVGGAVGVVD